MKHCHAPAASLKPNTSKNLTSSRWSCTWSRSCFRNTKHREHKRICLLHGILKLERGPWTQDGQCSISVLRTRRECSEDPSPLTVEKNSIANSSGSVLNAVGTAPGLGTRVSGEGSEPEVPRMLLHLGTVPEFLKRRAIQVAVWLKGTLLGDLSFRYS